MADYFRFYHDWMKQAERLSESERWRLLAGIAEYSVTGVVPEFRGNERVIFPLLSPAPDAPEVPKPEPKKRSPREDFERFWKEYPRKVGKQAALTAYGALMKRPNPPTVEQLIASVEAHKQTWNWKKEDGQYIPHPQTYLNQDRWLDDLTNELRSAPQKHNAATDYPQNFLTDEQLKRIIVDLDKDIE